MSKINRRHKVDSESIKEIGYDPDSKILEVTFSQGKTYSYDNVKADQFAELMNAESVGGHFSNTLRKSHKGSIVDEIRKSKTVKK